MAKSCKRLLSRKSGINLDVGCGTRKQKGWVGLDKRKQPGVDIVHDVQKFPWPLPANCAHKVILSHLWEHIEPKYRVRLMDEIWRIIKPSGQLFIVTPHNMSYGSKMDPEHYGCANESTFDYFDPVAGADYLYDTYRPKPWKVIKLDYNLRCNIEVILEPRKGKKLPDKKRSKRPAN